ncbi:Dam family site-specific DNA-(adenine-N6)-methyltransferase [Mycoplasma nasistruthionis]|uniref:site-specific DNA-methyltransferase (adenine-specific) n=1 Tax=Mycoplasma nasistruthionis TaxID=353852 RepID=A0A4Y6I6E6_9MOLU|nr:Dam family site-specific DNA-(adenine-N6)-methyltransferase [Mycoplasma nasistruthionis]
MNDINSELIDMYNCLSNKNKLQKLLNLCDEHQKNHSEQYFYQIRELDRKPNYQNLSEPEKAARLIYLNKTGFNGLYRVNLQGFFNVPYGKRGKFSLYEKDNVEQILDYFKKSNFQIKNTDYKNAIKGAESGDFVYFDPPYDVITKTTFKSYSKYDFAQEQQIELANTFKTLSQKGVKCMLSNHNTPLIRELYKDFNIHVVHARRNVNSKANGRGLVEEVIITNYCNNIED